MDTRRFLKAWLVNKLLDELGGEYEGVIAEVTEETVRSPFSCQKTTECVVHFLDSGYRLVLNKTMLQAMQGWFGPESDNWVGRRLRVFLRRVETTAAGRTRVRWQRSILCEDPHARAGIVQAPQVPAREPDDEAALSSLPTQMTADEIFKRPGGDGGGG